ncbi:MAG: hypothetical protein H6686_06545 [Fibrobacteria bacterium]|nr:hypothetical protein [Fibrobacteria bacterium]
MRWILAGSTLALLVLLSCGGRQERATGGDDMENFVRFALEDSRGNPASGPVTAYSDLDTLVLDLDEGGSATLPERERSWILFEGRNGGVMAASPRGGDLGRLRLGPYRPFLGWTEPDAKVSLRGLGVAQRSGPVFTFASIPPGNHLLEVVGADGVGGSLTLRIPVLDSAILDTLGGEWLRLPPLTLHSDALVPLARGDSTGCGGVCPDSAWTLANIPVTESVLDSSDR